MRKIIFAILAVVLLIFTCFIIYRGTNIGKFEIWGIKQISEENDVIDQKNADLATLVDTSYPNALTQLNNSSETMQAEKKKYEEEVTMASSSKYYMQSEKYKLEFLWTKIGNYAKDNNINPKMEVSNGSANGIYNLTITAVGKYKNVASFIYAIENDSRLGFKIEDFSMVQEKAGDDENTTNLVRGKFTCKEIKIDLKSLDNAENTNSSDDKNTDKDSTNDTNKTTNTNTTTNKNTNAKSNTNTTTNANEAKKSGNTNENANTTGTNESSENNSTVNN